MLNKLYNKSVINGHSYSRQPLAAGQKFLDQMTVKSGHHINESEVRGEIIPNIISISDRDEKFLITDDFGVRIVGGPVGSRYTKIIQFIDKASLVEIPNSNGESFQVVDKNGNPISNFIDPSDKPITNTKLSDGYTVQMFAEDNTTPISINYGWTINTLNGIVHFDSEFKPGSTKWENLGFGSPVIEGFIYIGKSTTDNFNEALSGISFIQNTLENTNNNAISIQPFRFSTDQMIKVGEAYTKEISPIQSSDNKPVYFQRMVMVIPGYGFEVTSLDRNETIVTEMSHLQNGDTQIFMDFPWETEYDSPIIRWNIEIVDGKEVKVPVIGKYIFSVATFVKNNGNKINVKDVIDLDSSGSYNGNSYNNTGNNGWACPTPDNLIEGGPGNEISDSSVNVNINLG